MFYFHAICNQGSYISFRFHLSIHLNINWQLADIKSTNDNIFRTKTIGRIRFKDKVDLTIMM